MYYTRMSELLDTLIQEPARASTLSRPEVAPVHFTPAPGRRSPGRKMEPAMSPVPELARADAVAGAGPAVLLSVLSTTTVKCDNAVAIAPTAARTGIVLEEEEATHG